MEIDISQFFNSEDPSEFSASIAETGMKDIGKRTWRAACAKGAETPLLTTPEQIDALRDYMKDFGAWTEEEIAAWTAEECNALFIQLVSGDMRETGLDNDPDDSAWAEYEANENVIHNLYRADDGRVFYSLAR